MYRIYNFITIALLGFISPMYANALTPQQELAKNTVTNYYTSLNEYAHNFYDYPLKEKVSNLFDKKANWVYNDLLSLSNGVVTENQEGDIDSYMGTIMGLWTRLGETVNIKGTIDENKYVEENDPDYMQEGLKVVWVTALKTITFSNRLRPIEVKETFKIKNGKIQVISTPEASDALIDALRYYNNGDYEQAYYGFIQQINNSVADADTYFYLGLMFRKGKKICKKLFPSSDLRDKLCAFYWMKCPRGREACYYFGIHKYYHLDFKTIKSPFHCGLMTVYKGEGKAYGYMDEKGKMIIPYKFYKAYTFSDKTKRALVQLNSSTWALIKPDGSYALKPEYTDINYYSTTAYVICKNNKWGLSDADGNIFLNPKYDAIRRTHEDLGAYKINGKWGFLDLTGNVVLNAKYDYVGDFSDGKASVRLHGNDGLIDKSGKEIVPVTFDKIMPFSPSSHMAKVQSGKKYGIIGSNGKLILKCIYDDIEIDDNKGIVKTFVNGKETKITFHDLKNSTNKHNIPIYSH